MEHGGNIREAEKLYGFKPGEMLDLSTGICPRPYPIPEHLLDPEEWRGLPQLEDEEALEHAFRSAYRVPDEAGVVAAPGSQALINILPTLGDGTSVGIPALSYSEHWQSWTMDGYRVDFLDAGEVPEPTEGLRNLVVVRPGNPAGEVHDRDWLLGLADELAPRNGVVVVDEAFADLDPGMSLLPWAGKPRLVVLRSFGKFFGLAGIRLGLAAGHADDILNLKGMLGPWPVSTPALRIGAAAFADKAFQEEQREWIVERHAAMKETLERHGFDIAGGTGLFTLLEVADAGRLHDHLAKSGVWTRDYDGKDKSRLIRIGLPDEAGLERLDEALKTWCEGGGGR